MLAACDAVLKPNCETYQLHVGSALVVGPGATMQILHREDDACPFFKVTRPNLVLASMWAISDFTASNGATNLVPGSHRWQEGREARPDEIVAAEMPTGSVLLWMSGTLHGAGADRIIRFESADEHRDNYEGRFIWNEGPDHSSSSIVGTAA
jgi:ectoine hydroxylase-related dioxygenase (phytanoyl-CoA dioxygenase family)